MKSRHGQRVPTPTPARTNWLMGSALAVALAVLTFVVLRTGTPPAPEVAPRLDMSLAMGLLSTAQFDDAEWVLRELLAASPDSGPARDELRWLLFNQLRNREVEAILEDALRRPASDLRWAIDLMMSEFRPQNPRESVLYWERMESLRHGQTSTATALGYCYWKLGRLDEARRTIQGALDRRPDDFRLQLLAAEFLLDTGDPELADPLLSAIDERLSSRASSETRSQPLSPEHLLADRVPFLKSLRAEAKRELEQALKHLEQAIALRPDELAYWQRRGQLQKLLGLDQRAAESFAKANELEGAMSQLTEIVLAGELEQLTPERCARIGDLYRRRGRAVPAEVWLRVASRGGPSP